MSSRSWQVKFNPQEAYENCYSVTDRDRGRNREWGGRDRGKDRYDKDSDNENDKDDKGGVKTAPPLQLRWARIKHLLLSRGMIYVVILLGTAACCYWSYLTSLYLVEDVYDSRGPHELEMRERFTLRLLPTKPASVAATAAAVAAAASTGTTKAASASEVDSERQALATLVAAYAICPAVAEVQLLWPEAYGAAPDPSLFPYSKTHCPVHVDRLGAGAPTSYGSSLPTHTDGVLLLDTSVEVACAELSLVHSVWRSGHSTLVGLLPRLHSYELAVPAAGAEGAHGTDRERKAGKVTPGGLSARSDSYKFAYYGRYHVWWNTMYSLLLPAAVFADAQMLQKSVESATLRRILVDKAECYHVGLSVWAAAASVSASAAEAGAAVGVTASASAYAAKPPIWAKVPFQGSPSADAIPSEVHAECLELLTRELQVPPRWLRYNNVKSVRASDTLSW